MSVADFALKILKAGKYSNTTYIIYSNRTRDFLVLKSSRQDVNEIEREDLSIKIFSQQNKAMITSEKITYNVIDKTTKIKKWCVEYDIPSYIVESLKQKVQQIKDVWSFLVIKDIIISYSEGYRTLYEDERVENLSG